MINDLVNYSVEFNSRILEVIGRSSVSADREILDMVFKSKMFSTERFTDHHNALNNYYSEALLKNKIQPIIIDCGANIGSASLFFSESYTESRVIGIEPGPENYELLCKNMVGRNFIGINAALCSKDCNTFINTVDFGPIAYRTGESGNLVVPGRSLGGIFDTIDARLAAPFILKIDIEGAEAECFEINSPFLNRAALVIMEPHDWMIPFQGVTKNFYKEISKHDFDILMFGENIFCFNNTLLKKFISHN